MTPFLQSFFAGLLFVTGTAILVLTSRRWMTGILAVQYIGVFLLVSVSWPLEIAVVKLVAGWMSTAVLFLSYSSLSKPVLSFEQNPSLPGISFKGFTGLLIGISVYSLVSTAQRWFLGATFQQILAGLLLLGLGLLQLGLSRENLRIIIGLLTVISGFEILYATLEASVLMTGLLAILNIGLAFLGAYLMQASDLEENL